MYTVKQVAKLLDVNDDTVRRWIRLGILESTIKSYKEGHEISEQQLAEFMKRKPKYDKIGYVEMPVMYTNDYVVALDKTIANLKHSLFEIEYEIKRLEKIRKELEL